MNANDEMTRLGFNPNQTPHPIFVKLANLRLDPSQEGEITRIETAIERDRATLTTWQVMFG